MKVYFISGLAADSRVFRNIQLPAGFDAVYLDWIKEIEGESLESYALRMADAIDRSESFILFGLSMGGMVATEIAKKYPPVAIILLSSLSTYNQFPLRFKISYQLKLYKLIPGNFFKSASLIKRFFTTENKEDKALLEQVIRDSDPRFIRWALGAILEWRNETLPHPMWHIHGSNDEILPMKNTNPTHIIKRGTHLMVLARAAEINKMIAEILDTVNKSEHFIAPANE